MQYRAEMIITPPWLWSRSE